MSGPVTERLAVERRLRAADEIGVVMRERSRSAGYPLFEDTDRVIVSDVTELAAIDMSPDNTDLALWELIEESGPETRVEDIGAILDLFLSNREITNATLARTSMHGDWNGVDEVQAILMETAELITAHGYNLNVVWRGSQDAKLTWTIEPELTGEEYIVAGHRKRMMMQGTEAMHGGQDVRSRFELDKLSSFAVDLGLLERINPAAVKEIRTIMLYSKYAQVNMDILAALTAHDATMLAAYGKEAVSAAEKQLEEFVMHLDRYGITFDDVAKLFDSPTPHELSDPTCIEALEATILAKQHVLTPAATTFYIHNDD